MTRDNSDSRCSSGGSNIVDFDELVWQRRIDRERKEVALRIASHALRSYERVYGRPVRSEREADLAMEWYLSPEGKVAAGPLPKDPNQKISMGWGRKLLDAFEREHGRPWDKSVTELRRFADQWLETLEGQAVALEIYREDDAKTAGLISGGAS
jgi:hypothetical protein